ncbi:hypothetical protein J3R82DRAFT_10725 [Butyriboletus roseoflavus]|nr:hypothetical protein J3R82DRAFT_10725 [Butyriboletus roseoflavus]
MHAKTLLRLSPFSLHSRALTSALNRPCPPPLPREQQREFEDLQRAAQMPLSSPAEAEAELALHPDARKPLKPDFEGDINPLTGEQGGPKTEPVRKWVEQDDGDWSLKGRVSDF